MNLFERLINCETFALTALGQYERQSTRFMSVTLCGESLLRFVGIPFGDIDEICHDTLGDLSKVCVKTFR